MWLLETAWRKLIQEGATKFLKETNVGKKITKAIAPKNKPQTPEGEGLSFGGTTMNTFRENRELETSSAIESLPKLFLKEAATKEVDDSYTLPFNWFKSLETKSLLNLNKVNEFKDNVFNATKGDTKSKENLKAKLTPQDYTKFDEWTGFITEARGSAKMDKKESQVWGGLQSGARMLPFGEAVLDPLSKVTGKIAAVVAEWDVSAKRLPSFSENEYAKQMAKDAGEYETATAWRIVWWAGWMLIGYWIYWKIFDKALLSNKALQSTSSTMKFQNAMRESYAKNPFLFNFTSNSAQDTIEYWVRKGMGDETVSLSDYVLWITAGWVFAKVFWGKKLDSVFDNVSQKDLSVLNDWLKKAKELSPDATDKEIFETIADIKMTSWLTFGELQKSFIDAGGKFGDTMSTSYDNVVNYFQSVWVRTSAGAGKKISNFLTDINEKISRKKDKWLELDVNKDEWFFKQDVINELTSRTNLTHSDVDEVISRKAKEYWIEINKSDDKLDIFDAAEEVVMKSDAKIQDLSNPKTLSNFKYQYLQQSDIDIGKLTKMQDELENLSSLAGTRSREAKIDWLKLDIKAKLQEFGFKSTKEAEDVRYKIDNERVKELAKANRKTWVKGMVTNAEKEAVRTNLIKETQRLESEAEVIMNKLAWVKSTNKSWDFAKIIQFTQLKQAIDSGNYVDWLRSFISINKNLTSVVTGKDRGKFMSNAVEASGGKVLHLTDRNTKKLKLTTDESIARYARENWYDGYTTQKLDENVRRTEYTPINDTFKHLENTMFWTDAKWLEKLRLKADVNEFTREASSQKNWEFKLSADEETWKGWQAFNFVVPFTWGKKGWRMLQSWDTPLNVFERVFGEDSFITRILWREPSAARSRWSLEKDVLESNMVRLVAKSWLSETHNQRKFMIYMTTRQGGMDDRIVKSKNLYIDDNTWKVYDTWFDTKLGTEDGAVVTKDSIPEWARKLTEDDIIRINKEVASNAKYQEVIRFLDNQFSDVASRLNDMHYRDTWVLIPTESKYFPIIYKNANYFKWGEEPRNSLSAIFSTSVQKWFLNARKEVPNDFEINTDLPTMIRHFQDNQLYYLNMKEPILRAKRALRNSNKSWIKIDELDEGVYYDKDKGILKYKDYIDKGVVEGKPIFSPELRKYVEGFIENMEHRWVIAWGNSYWRAAANTLSKVSTWTTIAANIWSMAAQYFSYADAIVRLGKSSPKLIPSLIRTSFIRNRNAINYSGSLRERMTEHLRWVALGKIFNKWDLATMSQTKWSEWLTDRALELSLRGMRKVDGEVSYWIWMTHAKDFLDKNHQYFPEVKITSDIDELSNTMPPAWFQKMINHSDTEMNRVMGTNTDFSFASEVSRQSPELYKLNTAIQKTFINRLLYLNHHLMTKWVKWVPIVVVSLWLTEFSETEREYWRTYYNSVLGKKEFKSLDKDLDFWAFVVKKDSHIGNILANNPSLNYENFENKVYDWVMKKATWKPELSLAEVYAARAMGRFFMNNVWNPMNKYEVTSQLSWFEGINKRNEKGEIPPWIRNDLEWGYAITKMMLPSLGDDIIPAAHDAIFDEALWKFQEDNYQLGIIARTEPELMKDLETKDYKTQGEFAQQKRWAYETQKVITEENKKESGIKESMKELIYKQYWYNPTKEELFEFVKNNKELYKNSWIKNWSELKSFFGTLWPTDKAKATVSEYQHLYTKSAEFILENDLKTLFKDTSAQPLSVRVKELNARINELESAWVIMNPDKFKKDLIKSMRNKWYVN